MSEPLKACPFCGSMPVIETWHGGAPTKRKVSCINYPGCEVLPSTTGETRAEAIRNWNTRTEPERLTMLAEVRQKIIARIAGVSMSVDEAFEEMLFILDAKIKEEARGEWLSRSIHHPD